MRFGCDGEIALLAYAVFFADREAGPPACRSVRCCLRLAPAGVWGLERGDCLMIGGENAVGAGLDPIFKRLASGRATWSER